MRLVLVCLVLAMFPGVALAQTRAAAPVDRWTPSRPIESTEAFALELRVGPYWPQVGNSSFSDTFGNDFGPLLAAEFEMLPLRIPYVGLLGAGLQFGWVEYQAKAFAQTGNARTDELTTLTLNPAAVVAVLRIDGLSRELGIPFVLTGKLGADFVLWNAQTGSRGDGSGVSIGFRYQAQLAMELDWIDRRAARNLDAEWGINHSYLFGEVIGSTASTSLPVGGVTFAFGLGLTF